MSGRVVGCRSAAPGKRSVRLLSAGVAVVAVAGVSTVALSTPAHADVDVIEVTNTADSGSGSLRDALTEAEGTVSDDQITFAPTVAGTIALTSGELTAGVGGTSGNLVVEGPGRGVLTVDAGGLSRVLSVVGSGGTVRPGLVVSGLTLTDGATTPYDSDFGDGGAIRATGADLTLDDVAVSDSRGGDSGGGVSLLGGSLTVISSRITGNSTTSDTTSGDGGGISVQAGGAGVAVTVTDSTISGNTTAVHGGGISAVGSAPVTITRSTLSGNVASYTWRGMEAAGIIGDGGGISAREVALVDSQVMGNVAGRNGGGVAGQAVTATGSTIADNLAGGYGGGLDVVGTAAGAELRVASSTITGNQASAGGGMHATGDMPIDLKLSTVAANTAVDGGGLDTTTDVSVQGTIVAMNTGGDVAGDADATLDRSLVQEFKGVKHVDSGGSVVGQDPLLGPLSDHGGATETSLPAPNSPAIDAGDSFGETSDQRGSARPVDDPGVSDAADGSDMGAVELTPAEQASLPQVASTARPVISGTLEVGKTLHTDGGTWEPANVSRTYQWFRNGVPIPGATKASYRLTPEDYDRNWYGEDLRKRISVRVMATVSGHSDASALSDFTNYVRTGTLKVYRPARLTGRLRVGSTLHALARVGSVSPRPVSVGYEWFLDGHRLQRAHTARLELRPQMRGERVRVKILYSPSYGYRRLTQIVRGQHPVWRAD